ncbi:FUSC family protein [Streptomyces sp. NPDC001381]|uniref:FUSC family protein n=1 Tax=Streptomyces sp. NPDC001381 TaxID=3364567 RepID=UPI0036BBEE2B
MGTWDGSGARDTTGHGDGARGGDGTGTGTGDGMRGGERGRGSEGGLDGGREWADGARVADGVPDGVWDAVGRPDSGKAGAADVDGAAAPDGAGAGVPGGQEARVRGGGRARRRKRRDVRGGGSGDVASAWLLPRVGALCDVGAAALRAGRVTPGPSRLDRAIGAFQEMRLRQAAEPAAEGAALVPVLRRQAALLGVAESVRVLEIAVRVGLDGRRTPPIEPRELFWYTEASTSRLWLRRIVGNMTLRSVQFHNAVRIALALAAARLVAGSFDLTHGFWVLLAVLTLSRTTVGETWAAMRGAVAGNLVGAVAAGALLIGVGQHTDAYAAILAPGMLLAFALGPLLGIAWAQGLFTLVVATAFAQITPATWRLAEARIVDVVTGSAVGLLCALLAWPAGARREVRRTMAGLLRVCGPLIQDTVGVLTAVPPGSAPPPPTLPVLHRMRLAESAYAQFRSEPAARGSAGADWHGVLIAAHQILLGAHWLPRFDLPASALPPGAARGARAAALTAARTTDRLAALCAGAPAPTERPPPDGLPPDGSPPDGLPPDGPRPEPAPPPAAPLPALIDLEMWLTSLSAQLAHVETGLPGAGDHAAEEATGPATAESSGGPAGALTGPGGHGVSVRPAPRRRGGRGR